MFLRTLEVAPKLAEKLKTMAVTYPRIEEIIDSLRWHLLKDAHTGVTLLGDPCIRAYRRELKHLSNKSIVAVYTLDNNHHITLLDIKIS